MLFPTDDAGHPLAQEFHAFIKSQPFPCVGAKSALAKGQLKVSRGPRHRLRLGRYADLSCASGLHLPLPGRPETVPELRRRLRSVSAPRAKRSSSGTCGRVCNPSPTRTSFSASATTSGCRPTRTTRISPCPSAGRRSSSSACIRARAVRPAAFPTPSSSSTSALSSSSCGRRARYEGLRSAILARDEALAGSINPMLARHGETSEARQYSGRAVEGDWVCPFRGRETGTRAGDSALRDGRDAA